MNHPKRSYTFLNLVLPANTFVITDSKPDVP